MTYSSPDDLVIVPVTLKDLSPFTLFHTFVFVSYPLGRYRAVRSLTSAILSSGEKSGGAALHVAPSHTHGEMHVASVVCALHIVFDEGSLPSLSLS